MKIVGLVEFRELPEWTWYQKGSLENGFGDWMIKGETWETDFCRACTNWPVSNGSEQLWERECMMDEDSSVSFPLEYSFGRDGCFDDKAKFFVLERDDLVLMKSAVEKAIDTSQPHNTKQPEE